MEHLIHLSSLRMLETTKQLPPRRATACVTMATWRRRPICAAGRRCGGSGRSGIRLLRFVQATAHGHRTRI